MDVKCNFFFQVLLKFLINFFNEGPKTDFLYINLKGFFCSSYKSMINDNIFFYPPKTIFAIQYFEYNGHTLFKQN